MRAAAVALLLTGCSSSSGAPACVVEGAYQVHYTVQADPGSCGTPSSPLPDGTTTVAVTGTHADVVTEGYTGSCPGVVSGCKLTAVCDVTLLTTGQQGNLQLSWTFTQAGFRGTSAATLPVGSGGLCTSNRTESGTRK